MNLFLPPAKSILNRHLVAASWTPRFEPYVDAALSQYDLKYWADDSRALLAALRQLLKGERDFDFKDGAAPLRFFAARLALDLKVGESATIDVGPRLIERAPEDLFAMLSVLGAKAEQKSLTIKIVKQSDSVPAELLVPTANSSQFASALELNLWAEHPHSKVVLGHNVVSKSFYKLSCEVRDWWSKARANDAQWPAIPPDAASACAGILYAMGQKRHESFEALSLAQLALQPDGQFVQCLERLGFRLSDTSQGLSVERPQTILGGLEIDLSDCSDLAPVLAALVAKSEPNVELKLPEHLNQKESRRIDLIHELQEQLQDHGAHLRFNTHGDHRFVMAVCVAQIWHQVTIKPSEYLSVHKSYPGFLNLIGQVSE